MKRPLTTNSSRIPKAFIPYGDRVVVQVIREDQTRGGVQLPETMKLESMPEAVEAWVVAIGPECKQAKEGQVVLMPPGFKFLPHKYRGHNYILIKEEMIYGFVDEETS